MDSFASKPASARSADEGFSSRIPFIGVVLAAAIALGSATVMSGFPMGGPLLFATLVAVGGGVVWLYAPRTGYWILLVGGVLTMAVSGVALAQGAVPWLLVAFWGGCALLLAAILHLTAGPGRSNTVTLVAVISLLALSALGLGQYVRTTWTPDERATLEHLPETISPTAPESAWVAAIAPAPEGAWRCAWFLQGTPRAAMVTVRVALMRDGWRIAGSSSLALSAEKLGEHLDISLADNPAGYPSAAGGSLPAGTRISVTVADAAEETP